MSVRSVLRRDRYALLGASSLAVVCAGGFLPWVASGSALRSSFEIAGVIDRLGPQDAPVLTAALRVWIMVPLACACAAAAYATGLRNTAVVITLVVSLVAGTVGLTTYLLGVDTGGVVNLVPAGPLTTGIGGVAALLSAIGMAMILRAGHHVERPHGAGAERK